MARVKTQTAKGVVYKTVKMTPAERKAHNKAVGKSKNSDIMKEMDAILARRKAK